MNKYIYILITFVILSNTVNAQIQDSIQQNIDAFLLDNQFKEALIILRKEQKNNYENPAIHFQKGICYFNMTRRQDEAIFSFIEASQLYEKLEDKQGYTDSEYYLSKAYQANYQYDEAIFIL